jgi:hypothetical protein
VSARAKVCIGPVSTVFTVRGLCSFNRVCDRRTTVEP